MSNPDLSPNLALPFLAPAQAQKHVTHNEALGLLDLIVQLVVQDFDALTPPESPSPGSVWALGAAPTGAWAGQGLALAAWYNGAWVFIPPRTGWRATGLGDGALRIWSGSAWTQMEMNNLDGVGIGTSHDATNRLAVAAAATLLTHAGTDHRLVLNKASAADTGSVLFQSGWSGRAEMGLAGSDAFALKVSADGSQWRDGLSIAPASGQVSLPNGVHVSGLLSGTAVTQTLTDTTAGRLLKAGDAGILGAPPSAPADIGATDNTLAPGAWHNAGTGAVSAGLPAALAASSNNYLFHHRRVSSGEVQVLLSEWSPNDVDRTLWFRRRTAGAWGAWKRVYDWGNVLGTVSQSGGSPTGAIIQRGSNANGSFVRFADGTQIVWKTLTGQGPITTASGSIFLSGAIAIGALAATFASPPQRFLSSLKAAGGLHSWPVNGGSPATATEGGSCNLARASSDGSTDYVIDAMFHGRWF